MHLIPKLLLELVSQMPSTTHTCPHPFTIIFSFKIVQLFFEYSKLEYINFFTMDFYSKIKLKHCLQSSVGLLL